jgi:hypothetical protein
MITAYLTIASKKLADLDNHVNEAISGGWQPYGSLVSRYSAGDEAYYVQSMVKTDWPNIEGRNNAQQ